MPIEKPDVIDFMTVHPKTGEVALAMVETRNWNTTPGSLEQLDAKFGNYAQFFLSGKLAHQYPDLARNPVCIRLEHFTPIPQEVAAALRQWAGRLSRIPVGVVSHRMYWNPLISWFQKLKVKLGGSDNVVRWSPEPGADGALVTGVQFTEEFVALLRKKAPTYQVQIVRELQFKIIAPGGKENQGFLENAYNHYLVRPENKDEIFQKYAGSMLEVFNKKQEPITRDRVVPVIKDRKWLEDLNVALKARGGQKELECVHEVYNEELVIAYAEDTSNNMQYLTPEKLVELKLELKGLRELACANLGKLLPFPDFQLKDGIYRIRAGGDYDASLLLVKSVWEGSKLEVSGEIVAAVPARDFLIATGSEDTTGIKNMRAMAEKIVSQAPYRLTSRLFVYRQGRFVVFEE